MIIYTENKFTTINFGIQKVEEALGRAEEFIIRKPLSEFLKSASLPSLVVSTAEMGIRKPEEKLEPGGFEIAIVDNVVYITGGDHTGAMYGLIDVAETIALYGLDAVKGKSENPYLKTRGVKFNLPFEPYANGEPFTKNIETCLDPVFWEKYIDFLALNRYNCLSLWSEHPFHMMFRLEKYPDTCPYSDRELEQYKRLFQFIFRRAKERGIDVYLITWNIRFTPYIARGLGLPEELGVEDDKCFTEYERKNTQPKNSKDFWPIRQHSEIIKDYFKECIKTLVSTYVDLKGIGTNCAEEMVGSSVERQDWVMETYLKAVEESGRDIPFIMRTNMGNGKIAKAFLDAYPSTRKFISWKYSNAHMYSDTSPQFEKLWGAWEGVDLTQVRVLYTVRNDDIHTLRWGDCDYLREYIKGMRKPYVEGFYWGADGYLWGKDFQHFPGGHKTWEYDFEKHWHQFELMGRLSYNPDLPEEIWQEKYKKYYGNQWGLGFYRGIKQASKIIPAVNRLFWIDYDFQWHPESLLSMFGFKTILDFVNGKPMPGIHVTSIREYVEQTFANAQTVGVTPPEIIKIIADSTQALRQEIQTLEAAIPCEYMGGQVECTLLDLKAWAELGRYYIDKFSAALELAYYEKAQDPARKAKALVFLEDGLAAWTELSRIWSLHYMPYHMARVKQMFGWPYYLGEVKKDIELARNIERYWV